MHDENMERGGMQKILIIDDDVPSSRLLKTLLERTGRFAVSVENDSAIGLDVSVALQPDLILMDIVMPHLDGTRLAYRIRSHEGLENVPIIFVTGVVPKESSSPHNKLGDFPFVAKPVDVEELFKAIEKALPSATRS